MSHSPNIQEALDLLEAERDHLADELRWVDEQIEAISSRNGAPAPAPARFEGIADTRQRIIDYLAEHPHSTAGEVAPALGLPRNSVSTRLTQMARAGDIHKAERGYVV